MLNYHPLYPLGKGQACTNSYSHLGRGATEAVLVRGPLCARPPTLLTSMDRSGPMRAALPVRSAPALGSRNRAPWAIEPRVPGAVVLGFGAGHTDAARPVLNTLAGGHADPAFVCPFAPSGRWFPLDRPDHTVRGLNGPHSTSRMGQIGAHHRAIR